MTGAATAGRGDLILGAIGSVLVCLGSFGVGDPPRNSALLSDLGLSWITYGHGKNVFGTLFWLGVFLMVFGWVRLGRRIISSATDTAPITDVSLIKNNTLAAMAGKDTAQACGSTTYRKICTLPKPMALAASVCPFGTASKPARKASAI